MPPSPSDLTQSLLSAAVTAGADAADALAVRGTSISIDLRGGKPEHAERSEGTEIGLRVLIGTRQACVSASDLKPETIRTMAERAVAMAREAPADPTVGLADPGQLARSWDVEALQLADPADEPSPIALEDDARRAEEAALSVNGIDTVEVASSSYGRHEIHLAATNGFAGGYSRTNRSLHCVAIVGKGTGMERDYYGESRVFQSDVPSADYIGSLAGKRTLERAGARKPKTGAYPVLFDERVSSSLIGHLLSAVNGAAIARGSSWARDLLNKQVLPDGLTLTEDPHRRRSHASRPFDAEGLPTAPRKIVENGTLMGWTLDLATSRKLGLRSTANAARGTSSPPSPSLSNVALTEGTATRDDLIRDMGTGLLVTSMIGSSVNATTGDYSRGASGFWIENGEIAHPVNECTIAGNLRDMLLTLVPANDGRHWMTHVVPSLLVDGLTIAGE